MAKVLLFHHALGRTAGVDLFADDMRQAGHTVYVPDLFEGRTFSTIQDGLAYVEEMGFDEVMKRGAAAAEEHPHDMVYAGLSLGVVPAQKLAQTRPGARGALFCYSCVPPEMFGTPWPLELPVQIHGMDADPYFAGEGDIAAAHQIVASGRHAELFLYPGDQHYFADSTLPAYDADATALLLQRVRQFLNKLDA